VRFRMTSDGSVGSDGWFIDDIGLTNGCGGVLRSGLLNASAIATDGALTPVYVTQALALPLTLLQFNARAAGSEVLLAWQTSGEINTSEFQAERSGDGLHWSALGTVAAKGPGNNNYQLYDNSPLRGINYYRLKMIDLDRQFTYSPVRQISMRDNGRGSIVIIPNPAHEQAVVHFGQMMPFPDIILYGANGQVVRHAAIGGNASYYTVATAGLPAGIYTVSVRSGSDVFIGKLVVAH
jgi:hypothetical protein